MSYVYLRRPDEEQGETEHQLCLSQRLLADYEWLIEVPRARAEEVYKALQEKLARNATVIVGPNSDTFRLKSPARKKIAKFVRTEMRFPVWTP